MNAAEYQVLAGLFDSAVALPASQRDRFIQERCSTDEMRRQLRRMLENDATADLQASTRVLSDALSTALTPGDDDIPERIGPYTLVRRLAVGGMGVVYLAEQSSPRRTVAFKLLRADIREAALVHHFEREASILARLRHAGIAHVYDAGMVQTAAGARPYLVIEYIEGQPIDVYARDRRLGTREIVALMIQACDAVEHAHSRGVVHRDLKPGNLFVTPDGAAKVLDFGIARIVTPGDGEVASVPSDMRSARASSMTLPHLLGTLSYMAPEQLEAGGDVDTRADVYALGVVLYELLTGRLPIDTHGRGLREAIEAVKHGVPAPISSIHRRLKGDLECIVSTALARDRGARYASAAALGEDLRRYLADRPITARPPSVAYAFSKAAKRHRAAFLGLGVATLVLAVGGPIVAFTAADLARERGQRLEQAERTLEASRLYEQATDLMQRHVQPGQARRLLDRAIAANPQFSLAYAARARLGMPAWRELSSARHAPEAMEAIGDLITAHAAAGGTVPDVSAGLAQAARAAAPRDLVARGAGFPDELQTAGETLLWMALHARPASTAQIQQLLEQSAACLKQAAAGRTDEPGIELAHAWEALASFDRPGAKEILDRLAGNVWAEQAESAHRARGILYSQDYLKDGETVNPAADPAACADAWSKVLLTAPADVEALVRLAESQRLLRRYDEALKSYSRAGDLAITDASIRSGMGEVFLDSGRYLEAAEHFGMAAALGTPPGRNGFLAGEAYSLAGQHNRALEYYATHLTAYPADAKALEKYVDLLIATGQPSAAQSAVDRFAAASDDAAMILSFQHYVILKGSDPGITVSDVLADELDQSEADAQVRLADAYASVGWYDQAADALQCATDAGVQSPHTLLRAIGVHLSTGDREKAREIAGSLLRRTDVSASNWDTIARALDELTLCEDAIVAAEQASGLEPARREHTLLLASLLLNCRDVQCQNPARAADLLAPIAASPSASVEQLDAYAESLMRVGRYREARSIAERAVGIDPAGMRRRLWVAIASASGGDRGTAQEQFRRVEELLAKAGSEASRQQTVESLEPWYSQARAMVTFSTLPLR